MGTHFQSKEDADRDAKWLVVDAEGIPLGRVATTVAGLLRGKHKTSFTKHVNGGDFVVVLNAAKVVFTGNKLEGKLYRHHTQYPGGLREVPAGKYLAKNPEGVIEKAVRGMLPKGALAHQTLRRLKVYRDANHPHAAQLPQAVEFKTKVLPKN